MALYPSLEDMKIDHLMGAQKKFPEERILSSGTYETKSATAYALKPSAPTMPISAPSAPVYPHLGECIHLELTPNMIAANMPEYLEQTQTMEIVPKANNAGESVKSRVAGSSLVLPVNKNSAAMAGHGFGDQILQTNGNYVAGFSIGKLHDMFEECPLYGISAVVHDSYKHFGHSVALHKDCLGKFGVSFKDGKIMDLVLNSSAASSETMTDHSLLEAIGPNVVGLKDNKITGMVAERGNVITDVIQIVEVECESSYSWILSIYDIVAFMIKRCQKNFLHFSRKLLDWNLVNIWRNSATSQNKSYHFFFKCGGMFFEN